VKLQVWGLSLKGKIRSGDLRYKKAGGKKEAILTYRSNGMKVGWDGREKRKKFVP
jgi:hypothetical protein